MLGWAQDAPLHIDTLQVLKFKQICKDGRQVKMESFNQLLPFQVYAISRQLKQLSKVSVRCHSQEYFFGVFSANYYQSICGRVYF